MTRGWMTLAMLYYLNDDDGKHDHQRDDDDKRADDFDQTDPNIENLSCNQKLQNPFLKRKRTQIITLFFCAGWQLCYCTSERDNEMRNFASGFFHK